MSRSNGSQPHPTGHAPLASGYDVNPDPRAWNPRQPAAAGQTASANPAAPQYQPAQSYQPAPAYQPVQQRPVQTQQPAYSDPYAQHGGYYQAPAAQTAGRGAQSPNTGASYTPQFDPYVPATPAYQPAPAAQPAAPFPDLRGSTFDQWAGHQPQQQQPDPRGYDLASYGNDHQLPYSPTRPSQIVPQQPAQAARAAEWPQSQGHASQGHAGPAHGQYAQQGYDTYQQHSDAQVHANAQDYAAAQSDPNHAQGYDENYAEDGSGEAMEDEAPRGRRGMLIAATLAGAIFVGGGLTYAYNALLGSGAGGPPPLVKSASGPAKVKPSEPGGKQFDHADSKVLGRLNDNGTAASGGTDAAGSKKVSTLVVKPDGTIEPPAPAEPVAVAPESGAPAQPSAAVPGLSVVSVGGTPQAVTLTPAAAAPDAKAAAAVQQVAAPAGAAQKPLVVSPPAAAPKTPAVISTAAAPAVAAPAEASLVETAAVAAPEAIKKPAIVKKAAVTTAAAPAVNPAPTGAGYMAVIASVPASAKSRMDALTRWADMQQKYGSILQSKTMDVQEANLGEKGTYHRLLVGPPGSKDTANSVCSQLKAAGHADCWVMAY